MKSDKLNDVQFAQRTMLRIADSIEDAPYEFESARVIDMKLAASCSQDFEGPGAYRPAPKKRRG